MSWAVEEWKDGLPARALQKVTEMETQLEKLRKDQRQRQLQIDTVEGDCEKQKKKVEAAKSELSALKRENQSLMDACDSLQTARQKLSHELQQRETQTNCLEGQLASARSHTDKIEQELKRCKNELECQSSVSCSEVQSLSTPHHKVANNSTIYPEARERNTSDEKYEHLYEKYSTEVAERKRLENELKVLQIKLVNQTQAATSTSRQAISRQQASSSIFSWHKTDTTTPARSGLFTEDTPLKCTSASSVFSWENEHVSATKRCGSALSSLDVVPTKRGLFTVPALERPAGESTDTRDDAAFGQEQRGVPARNSGTESVSSHSQERELEQRVHHQKMELESYASKLSVATGQLESARTELAEKERSLLNSLNELSKLNVQHEQAVAKVTVLEQKLKHVAEELNCQRQNAESARLAAEQRLKDKEREQQEEVARLEHTISGLDQQLNQTKTKLGQELQHTKHEHNVLQAEFDKALLQKQHLEKEVQELKQVSQKANDNVKLHQDMTKDAKCSLEEAIKEKINLSCNLEQSTHRARKFEDDMKTLKQELHDSQRLQEDLQRQGAGGKKTRLDEGDQTLGKRCKKSDFINKAEVKRMKPFPEELSTVPRESDACQLDGLLEVVKKGFADIPMVLKISPHVNRRTTVLSPTTPASCSSPTRRHPILNLQPRLPTSSTTTANNPTGKEQGTGNFPLSCLDSPMTVITNSPKRVAPACGSSKPAHQCSLSRLRVPRCREEGSTARRLPPG